MRIYNPKKNVLEAARERIAFIFDEFPNVVVNISGGKDSTVVFNLAMEEARKRGRLPLPVMFIDQEAEWEMVIEHVRSIMYREDVQPFWLQCPILLTNSTSVNERFLDCWAEGKEWLREKEPIAIKENVYGTKRFHAMFTAFLNYHYHNQKACYIAGVRVEESPGRQLGLSTSLKYKWVPWGKCIDKKQEHYAFYPIYDWSYRDVWKAIFDHGWRYTRLYDYQYMYGLPISQMRVSNVHHETALYSLFYMQEVEPETWDKLTRRLRGIHTAGTLRWDTFCPDELPFMFSDWYEYRDYLLENLVVEPEIRDKLKREFHNDDRNYVKEVHPSMLKRHINSILVNDVDLTRIGTWRAAHLNYRVNIGSNNGN
jgi:predicted phosphoadenosine phosphosulfate sulfurtransferase